MKKIVIFGGTFDPVHIGHLHIYQTIKKQFKFDKFLIIPTKNPPLKNNPVHANASNRLAMLKLMFGKYSDVEIDQYELAKKNNNISYTINTIQYLSKKYPYAHLYLAIGLDRYLDFKQWKNWQKILEMVTLIVIPRNKPIRPNLSNIVIRMPLIKTSSFTLRQNPSVKYLSLPIAKYIADNGLYIDEQIKPLFSKSRYEHTLRVCDLAMELAQSIDKCLMKKVYIAAMYHDVCKEFDHERIRKYTNAKHNSWHTIHGIAGSNYIKKHFNIYDKDVLDAIGNHVIPSKEPSLLTKILYCADKLEPKRTKKDIPNRLEMIKLVKKDINKYFWKLFIFTQAKYKKTNI